MANNGTAVETIDPNIVDRLLNTVNDQYFRISELEANIRHLDIRIDAITPKTLNVNVVPTSKILVGGVIVGAALGGYIAYVEVQRRFKNKK